ncbi:hypothetical protein V5799_032284 [Amblyomma americanum]|uniref:Serine carboxypeptidase n=1 Tax=Amblyomma americanum TaxID=6943 RepID=A0AAQ4DRM0_AMBAM
MVANLVFLDAPAGSGYSYDATGNYTTNDEQAADDTYLAILDFYRKFSTYSSNALFLTAQGVSATHVALLVERLIDEPAINLTGYAINNGVLDERSRANSLMFFSNYHGLFGRSLWKKLTTNCCNGIITRRTCNFVDSTTSSCDSAVKEASMIVTNQGLNIFNLYSKCETPKNGSNGVLDPGFSSMYHTSRVSLLRSLSVSELDVKWSPACVDTADVSAYLNRQDVRKALHVDESPLQWQPCSDVIKYNILYHDLREIVRKIATRGKVRALFYYGDVDMMSNFLGGKWFLDSLGFHTVVAYFPWLFHQQVNGFAQFYDGNMEYVTVKGAGYMVSRDQPSQSLYIISHFIHNNPF